MKKLTLFLPFCTLIAISCSSTDSSSTISSLFSSSSSSSSYIPTSVDLYKTRTAESAIPDYAWRNGFGLMSPETTSAHVESIIDYNGTAETDFYNKESETTYYWTMCQWWTPYTFSNATYSYNEQTKTHKYVNESRLLEVSPDNASLRMRLNSDIEYQEKFGGTRPSNESWSHFLIQTNFIGDCRINPSTLSADNGDGINFKCDVRIDESTYLGEGSATGTSCSQLMFYTVFTNLPPEGSNPDEVGVTGQCMWFGMPIYDSRYKTVQAYKSADVGFTGATGHLIWNLPSAYYMPSKGVEMGTTYHIDFNVLEYLQDAFVYGVTAGYLPNCQWQNMYLTYMNFGWELPGEFLVDSTISNMDIYISHNN